ncbi:MAG: hypothetical protein M0R00_02835 [Candidatus Omnitrophica bacterium]|jgi:hypothetical protein|nr:hypothetical protein [Candidatus Omnitrophota bacterium]
MKPLVIIGSAPSVFEDLSGIPNLESCDHMAVGLSSTDKYFGRIDYVCNNHPENIPAIREIMMQRHEACGGNYDFKIIGPVPAPGVDIVEPFRPPTGSSAITGALSAIRMGYRKIILAGCPLTGKAPGGNSYEEFRQGWNHHKPELIGLVKSMSGWTRELLGAPTTEWLSDMTDRITVGCCWDGKDYYPPEYINILYNSVLRNTTIPFDFVCYVGPDAERPARTDAINKNIRIVPVGLPSWWSAMPLFQKNPPGVTTKTILYLDLDIVIIGSLDDIINFPAEQAHMKDEPSHMCRYGRERYMNTSVTLLRNGAGAKVWDAYVKCGMPTWDALRPPSGAVLRMAAQEIINHPQNGIRYELFPEWMVCSYKFQVLKKGIPDDCRVVVFHGQPKPAACMHEPFVRENWR